MNPDHWKVYEKVTEAKNKFLTRPFSKEEIKKVVSSMELNMDPGPDHIPIEFCQVSEKVIEAKKMNS